MIVQMAANVEIALTILDCSECGVVYGLTRELEKRRRSDGGSFYCPNGHGQVFSETTEAKLKRTQQELRDALERVEAARSFERRAWDVAAERAEEVKTANRRMGQLRRRVNAGVCPHCHRTVKQMAAHIKSKHPDELTATV